MTTGGKSMELIVDHLCCGLGPWLNLRCWSGTLSSERSRIFRRGGCVESKSNCWVRRARRARIRRLLTPEQEYGVRLTPESQVKSNCLSVATSDHGTHLATSSGIVTWIIFLRSRTPEYVAKSIAFFRLLFKSVEPWLAPDLLLDRLLEACDPSAVVYLQSTP